MTEQLERMLPLYEAKMIHHYDHRWATYEKDGSIRDVTAVERSDPRFASLPRYWVREQVVADRLDGRWDQEWMLAWRRIARSTDERTLISAVVPGAAFGDSLFLMLPVAHPELGGALQTALASFALDFAARQKIGGTNASFFLIEQLPVPTPASLLEAPWAGTVSWATWLDRRARWLSAQTGDQRADIRAELDAAMFHIYGIDRDDVAHIMDTFPIVKRKDEAVHGEYRTKLRVLEFFDQMRAAIDGGGPYVSPFDDLLPAVPGHS